MFDKREWMEEVGKKPGKDWVSFRGRVNLEFCDIRLKDGREIGPCWPKTTDFVDLSSEDEDQHPMSEVTHVRYYTDSDWDEIEDEDDDVDECEDGE
jgi:hypothetical protein